ncbi:MAG: AAA family ATPase [Prolixibacteraceae bacterium]|nr:AAA family ATPase [Prolixibacteraceae bacterium]
MQRSIYQLLIEWKKSDPHKVLLLRGARQVGKTFVARELGKTFTHFVEVNFERDVDVQLFFDQNFDPERICISLSAYYGIPIVAQQTLLFFDEIQACPKAIQSLRFFYESKPNLHVIAAGSLLEFVLADLSSFGVGRIRSLFMYPMSFDEFLYAHNEGKLVDLKKQATSENPLNPAFQHKLTDYLKKFLLTGGMPEVVKTYLKNGSNPDAVQKVLADIRVSLWDDFVKYKKRSPVLRLREVLDSAMQQAGGKYIYSKAGESINAAQAKEAIDLLEMAGLIHKIYHTSGQGIPLGADANHKIFKVLFLDTGLLQQSAGLRLADFLVARNTEMLNKGRVAEIFAGLEMIKYDSAGNRPQLYYWHREKRGSTAEVDYLFNEKGAIRPVEIKSGSSGKMQSLYQFLGEREGARGIRISMENFGTYDKIDVVPLYAISNLFERGA